MTIAAPFIPDFDHVVRLKLPWGLYNALVRELGDSGNVRLNYDGETLEIMSPGSKHEFIANLLAAMIDAASVEWSVNLTNLGSATFGSQARGFEADKTYYLDVETRIRDVGHIDLAVDPPPDLVVEVDITSSSSNRMATYAALGVPEVWRFHGEAFAILGLVTDSYVPIEVSRVIRGLPAAEIAERIKQAAASKGTTLAIRIEWQRWLRDNRRLYEHVGNDADENV